MATKYKAFVVSLDDLSDEGGNTTLEKFLENRVNEWLETVQTSAGGIIYFKLKETLQSYADRVLVLTIFYEVDEN